MRLDRLGEKKKKKIIGKQIGKGSYTNEKG